MMSGRSTAEGTSLSSHVSYPTRSHGSLKSLLELASREFASANLQASVPLMNRYNSNPVGSMSTIGSIGSDIDDPDDSKRPRNGRGHGRDHLVGISGSGISSRIPTIDSSLMAPTMSQASLPLQLTSLTSLSSTDRMDAGHAVEAGDAGDAGEAESGSHGKSASVYNPKDGTALSSASRVGSSAESYLMPLRDAKKKPMRESLSHHGQASVALPLNSLTSFRSADIRDTEDFGSESHRKVASIETVRSMTDLAPTSKHPCGSFEECPSNSDITKKKLPRDPFASALRDNLFPPPGMPGAVQWGRRLRSRTSSTGEDSIGPDPPMPVASSSNCEVETHPPQSVEEKFRLQFLNDFDSRKADFDSRKAAAESLVSLVPRSKIPPPKPQNSGKPKNRPKDEDSCPNPVEKKEDDVLCCRGGESNNWPGNKRYRRMVAERRCAYQALTDKAEKTKMSNKLVDDMHDMGARFLKKSGGQFNVMKKSEARRKVAQNLRETKEFKWT